MSGYVEALEAHNAMHDPKAAEGGRKKQSKISDERLRNFMRAHGMNGDG